MTNQANLSHVDSQGQAHMVDVGGKAVTVRVATAEARVRMRPETLALVAKGGQPKGDVLAVARIAGIQAAKKCADLIPLCHPLALNAISVDFDFDEPAATIIVRTRCSIEGKTGVEMEALTAASVAGLTIYDMCKAVDKGIVIDGIRLISKTGGKSGTWQAGELT